MRSGCVYSHMLYMRGACIYNHMLYMRGSCIYNHAAAVCCIYAAAIYNVASAYVYI